MLHRLAAVELSHWGTELSACSKVSLMPSIQSCLTIWLNRVKVRWTPYHSYWLNILHTRMHGQSKYWLALETEVGGAFFSEKPRLVTVLVSVCFRLVLCWSLTYHYYLPLKEHPCCTQGITWRPRSYFISPSSRITPKKVCMQNSGITTIQIVGNGLFDVTHAWSMLLGSAWSWCM